MDPLQPYREAVPPHPHKIFEHHNGNSQAPVHTEADCLIKEYLHELVPIVTLIQSDDIATYQAAVRQCICAQCRCKYRSTGTCPLTASGACCLWRYLPVVIAALEHASPQQAAS